MKYSAILILTSFVGLFVQASEEYVVVKAPEEKSIIESTSEFNRSGKKYSFYLESDSGQFLYLGFAGAYWLDAQSQILVDYLSNPESSNFRSNENIQSSTIGAHYKRFYGNSFFVRAGANYRQVSAASDNYADVNYFMNNNTTMTSFSGSALDVVLGLGNEWQWKNFLLGCDWLRLSAPVLTRVNSSNLNSNNAYTMSDLQGNDLRGTSAEIGIHIGASF